MSLLREARTSILISERNREKATAQYDKTQREAAEADRMFAGIHADGMAVIEQYAKPVVTKSFSKRLRRMIRRVNPFHKEFEYRRRLIVAVEERGLPSVGVWIDEKVGRQGQRLEIGVDYTDGKLFSTVDTQGQHSWDIMVPKKYSPWEMESDWRKKHKTPLEEAKKWRGLMDTVSKLRPIDRAVMSR